MHHNRTIMTKGSIGDGESFCKRNSSDALPEVLEAVRAFEKQTCGAYT